MTSNTLRFVVACALVSSFVYDASADDQREDLPAPRHEEPHKRHTWVWDSLSALRLNPKGAIARVRSGYRIQLWDRPGLLYEESFGSAKVAADLTPAYVRFGGEVELQPIAALRLWARYDYLRSFGNFSYTQSYSSPNADYSDSASSEVVPYGTEGEQLTVGGYLQGKLRHFAARTQLEGTFARLDLASHDGVRDTVFYDGWVDTVVPNGGWSIMSETDLVWLVDSSLMLSLRYSFAHVFYRDSDFSDPAEQREHDNTPWHRLGPVIHYTLFDVLPVKRKYAPSVALLAQWWLKHRFRAGQDSHQAIPFMLLVLFQQGEFL